MMRSVDEVASLECRVVDLEKELKKVLKFWEGDLQMWEEGLLDADVAKASRDVIADVKQRLKITP